MRILIVDDDYVSRIKLKTILQQNGDCDAVATGSMALAMFKSARNEKVPYDLITLDIEMPEVDGYETLRSIRDIEKKEEDLVSKKNPVKVIMITVKNDIKSVSASYYQGCEGYCTKPVTPEKIKKALDEVGFEKSF